MPSSDLPPEIIFIYYTFSLYYNNYNTTDIL